MDVIFAFKCEWRDQSVNLAKPLQLLIYPDDSTVEIADPVHRKMFLKRTSCKIPEEIYIGGQVTILGRRLDIIDYANEYTRINWQARNETCELMVKEGEQEFHVWLGTWLLQPDMQLDDIRTVTVSELDASVLEAQPGVYCAMKWRGKDIKNRFSEYYHTLGPLLKPSLIVEPRLGILSLPRATVGKNCTCVVIKPHIFDNRHKKSDFIVILNEIKQSGFSITDYKMKQLSRKEAEDFLEIYRSVLYNFDDMVDELCSGQSLALEIVCKGASAVKEFRKLAGPHDPKLAREVNPMSLRARFGQSISRNAIHCTDLEEDGPLEVEYWFNLLK